MFTHFNELQSNLSEIYTALQSSDQENLNLYASSATTICYEKSLMGYLSKVKGNLLTENPALKGKSIVSLALEHVVYNMFSHAKHKEFVAKYYPKPQELNVIKNVLKYILNTQFDQAVHRAYSIRQEHICHSISQLERLENRIHLLADQHAQKDRYAHFLAKELKGSPEEHNPLYVQEFFQKKRLVFNADDIRNRRHLVINFHHATRFFWKIWIKDNGENMRLRQALLHLVPLEIRATLKDGVLYQALKKELAWTRLEAIIEQDIPIALLAKLHNPKVLKVDEKAILNKWILILNEKQEQISLKLFSKVLIEIANVIQLEGSFPTTLADIVYWLDKKNCQLMKQEDEAWMDERERLKPGSQVECNGKVFILGDLLSPPKLVNDQYKIYALVNKPHYVIKLPINRFRLFIEAKQVQHEKHHWGVRFVKTIENLEEDPQLPIVPGLDRQGKCVINERLVDSFDREAWTSQQDRLNERDERRALILTNHLYCMRQWKGCVKTLSFAHLMWDKDGCLTSTQPLVKGKNDYNLFEEYFVIGAQDNLPVLNFMMHVGKFYEEHIAVYYRDAVVFTLRTGKTDLVARPLPLGERHFFYDQRVENLCVQAKNLRINCFNLIKAHLRQQGQYNYKQAEEVQNKLYELLVKSYLALPTSGRFPPDFQQHIVNHFLYPDAQINPPVDDFDRKAYYEEKYQLMMKYNQAILEAENIQE